MIKTITKRIGRKHLCVYCTKPANSDHSGSMHNNDWEDFWSCDCIGVNAANTAQREIYRLEGLMTDLRNKHTKYFNKIELEKKIQDLKTEYRFKI